MKKLISSIMLALIALVAQAQILTPVKWKIKLDDKGGAPEKEIVFTATADKGWHLYDMNLPEGGPVSTSFTFETLNGADWPTGSFCKADHGLRRAIRHEPSLVSGYGIVHPKTKGYRSR